MCQVSAMLTTSAGKTLNRKRQLTFFAVTDWWNRVREVLKRFDVGTLQNFGEFSKFHTLQIR